MATPLTSDSSISNANWPKFHHPLPPENSGTAPECTSKYGLIYQRRLLEIERSLVNLIGGGWIGSRFLLPFTPMCHSLLYRLPAHFVLIN